MRRKRYEIIFSELGENGVGSVLELRDSIKDSLEINEHEF